MFGGLANVVVRSYRGFQFAGLFNTAGRMEGFRFGGLGNISGDLKGFQFGGLFNVARKVSGAQFAGLINIADSCDYPIALLNIIKNGEYGLGITYNEMGSTMLTLRSGGRVMYGILGVGYNHKDKDAGLSTEGGFGAHINLLKWFRINNEIKAGTLNSFSDEPTFYGNYALLPAFRLNRHLEIFGGLSVNYLQTDNTDNTKIFPAHSLWKKFSESKLQQLYAGFQVGMQYIF